MEEINISVTDPTKHSDSTVGFTTYKINTLTNMSIFSYSQYSVIRRYSDFVWLQSQLGKA